ncbi:MAG: ATP-dependent DNA helicase RecG [Clostridia bacterium]|nr:ATP-dependent DNA helicase RecG [Clostridia bacterium]
MANLNDNIQYLKGVGEKRALLFKKLGTQTIGALLRFYPRSYENWSDITPIAEARGAGNVCIKATVTTPVKENFIRKNMVLYKFTVADSSGSMLVTIFNNKYDAAKIHMGEEFLFFGKLSTDSFYAEMSSPKIRTPKAAGIRPIYSAVSGLSSTAIENQVKIALSSVSLEEFLPPKTIEENGLCSFEFALSNIHFPESEEALEKARKRLVFEELFLLQTSLLLLKNINRGRTPCVLNKDYTEEFIKALPFSLTGAQRRAINDCVSDMSGERPMNRLVQGDVGSGKTAVCAAVSYNAVKNGFQAAVMVPTEILAEQHFATFKRFFENTGISCDLLTGRLTKKQKELATQRLLSGETDIVIGTHALLSEKVEFNNLGLVVTDEQHRFGVEQRANLTAKGEHPHVLVMSATPIPRTLALIIYGDLDVSIIDEYPKGRIPIESYSVSSKLHPRVYNYIKKHIAEGRQGYIVCPLVEENDTDLIPAEEYYEKLKENEFKGYRLGLIHGKMKAKEKDVVMREMALGNIDLLIATTVIEVGIDVPNAAIMVIENAERFGLSQLHQLRGRIGRGGYKSTCIFISDGGSLAKKRLDIMCSTNDGFKIADEDLKLRGPGDFLGNRQHGLPELHIADFVLDIEVLRSAGVQAKKLLADDYFLQRPENQAFKKEIKSLLSSMKNN